MSPTVFQDNVTIPDGERLFRRIALLHLVPDENTGSVRVSSGAFKDREMSVNLESTLLENGGHPAEIMARYPGHRLVSLKAEDARRLQQAICHDPMPDDLSHGLVYGVKNGKTPERLRSFAVWVIPPEPPQSTVVEAEKKMLGLK